MSQQTQEPFEEFMEVIRELTSLAGAIAGVEEAKAEAAAQKRHQFLDGFIQEEQAQILKLRGLEQRRLRLAKALGWESLTFRQILEKAPPRQSQLLKPVFYDLEQKLGRLQKARKSSEQIIRVRLHELEGAIAQMQGGPYDNAGNVSLNPPAGSKMRDKYV
ncbi:MAG: hypothetical protein HFG60_09320 [Lachnospiraceae bacterium]|nr:hypothetical protein [Lachnospiraceae bacterium]